MAQQVRDRPQASSPDERERTKLRRRPGPEPDAEPGRGWLVAGLRRRVSWRDGLVAVIAAVILVAAAVRIDTAQIRELLPVFVDGTACRMSHLTLTRPWRWRAGSWPPWSPVVTRARWQPWIP